MREELAIMINTKKMLTKRESFMLQKIKFCIGKKITVSHTAFAYSEY